MIRIIVDEEFGVKRRDKFWDIFKNVTRPPSLYNYIDDYTVLEPKFKFPSFIGGYMMSTRSYYPHQFKTHMDKMKETYNFQSRYVNPTHFSMSPSTVTNPVTGIINMKDITA